MMKIDMVFDYEMGNDLTSKIQNCSANVFKKTIQKTEFILNNYPILGL